jgi:hypothetical protein
VNAASLDAEFAREGFVRTAVFPPHEVEELRQEIRQCLAGRNQALQAAGIPPARDLTSRDLLGCPRVLAAIAHPRIAAVLRGVLGEGCQYLPDFEVHVNQYGIGSGGWHIDCGSEIPADYLLEPNYRFVKCGIYLQDNGPELAGGIDVLPRAHRWFPPFGGTHTRFRAQLLATEVAKRWKAHRVMTKPGDFVTFDSRLPHRGSAPGKAITSQISASHSANNDFSGIIPPGREKMVIYFDACRRGYAQSFLENSVRRARDEMALPATRRYRAQYLGLRYPDDFPAPFRARLEAERVELADYRGADKNYWTNNWNQPQGTATT